MGFSGVSKFKNMIKALQNRDYKLANIEMLEMNINLPEER